MKPMKKVYYFFSNFHTNGSIWNSNFKKIRSNNMKRYFQIGSYDDMPWLIEVNHK